MSETVFLAAIVALKVITLTGKHDSSQNDSVLRQTAIPLQCPIVKHFTNWKTCVIDLVLQAFAQNTWPAQQCDESIQRIDAENQCLNSWAKLMQNEYGWATIGVPVGIGVDTEHVAC